MVTLGVYLIGSGLTAATPEGGKWFIFLYATRVIAGMGIGGEYAAINSAIDEMIPARYRGRVDLAVNGTYWAGAFLGTHRHGGRAEQHTAALSWRIAYVVGPVLALVIIYVRRHLPESPRWQIMHGREKQAEASIAEIEDDVGRDQGRAAPRWIRAGSWRSRPTEQIGYLALLRVLFSHYPSRSVLGRDADDHPVVPVQRDLLHLRAGAASFSSMFQQATPATTSWPSRSGTWSGR